MAANDHVTRKGSLRLRLRELAGAVAQGARVQLAAAAARLPSPRTEALLSLPAAYFIDVLVMGDQIERLATAAIGDEAALGHASRLLVPAAILVLDVFMGFTLAQLADSGQGPGELRRLVAVGLRLAWACIMPLAFIATSTAQVGSWSDVPEGQQHLTILLACLSFTGHAAVVFTVRQLRVVVEAEIQ